MTTGQATSGGREVEIDRIVFSAEQIAARVRELAYEISHVYDERDRLLVLGLLKGSFIFMADLVREITVPHQIDFLVASSYGTGTVSSGEVHVRYGASASLEGRAVLLVEDIIDSGTTLATLVPELRARGPRSVEVCALLHKRLEPTEPEARWVGFDAPNEFLVGYGLDYAEDFRHLPHIASLRSPA
jgi:hypoxanthine phosphoribosyltransferase